MSDDAEQIRRQLARWMHWDENYQDDSWVDNVLDDDFTFVVGDASFVGKDAIRDLNRARNDGPPRGRHILSEPAIEFTGPDAAVVTTSYLYVTAAGGGYEVSLVGSWRDEFVRTADGEWRVRSRTNTHLTAAAPS